jgi:hypothetical protein
MKTDFKNGNEYRRLRDTALSMPTARLERLDREALRWHNENVFRSYSSF